MSGSSTYVSLSCLYDTSINVEYFFSVKNKSLLLLPIDIVNVVIGKNKTKYLWFIFGMFK